MLKLIWPVFILLVLAQWWVPGQMIWRKEGTLHYGTTYKLRSAPVDPGDPFRGRYIVLNFDANTFTVPASKRLAAGNSVYVTFIHGRDGFAQIKNITESKPPGRYYLQTTISYTLDNAGKDSSTIYLNYPFDKFFMEEYKAPRAETRYNESRRDTAQKTYALVSLLNGDAIVKDVFINDSSLVQILQQAAR